MEEARTSSINLKGKTNMTTMEMVNKIPVDQTAPATSIVKKYLLDKIQDIREAQKTLEKESKVKQEQQVLDAYKKAVGFSKIANRLEKLTDELKKTKSALRRLGLTENGNIIPVDEKKYWDSEASSYQFYSQEEFDRIQEVQKLLKAVWKRMDVFSTMDQLEARMMFASTVGEAMAIVNAVAGQDVFKIQTKQLQLENGK